MRKSDSKFIFVVFTEDLLDELYPEKLLNPSDPVAKAKQKLFVDRFGNGVSIMLKVVGLIR